MNFQDYCKKFQAHKESRGLNREITRDELASLREKFKGSNPGGNTRLHEAVSNFRKYKESKGLGKDVSFREFKSIREKLKKAAQGGESLRERKLNKPAERKTVGDTGFKKLIESYRDYKVKSGKGDKVSYGEIKSLREKASKLREADAGFDPNAGLAAPAPAVDPNAVAGAMPAAAPVDPTISAQIQDVKNSVDALAQAAGIQTAPLGADPNAGIPPADGMGADGAAAQVPQQVMESLIAKFSNFIKLKEQREPSEEELSDLREKANEIHAVSQFKNYIRIREKRNAKPAEIENLKKKLSEAKKTSQPKSKLDQIKERIADREAQRKSLHEKNEGSKEAGAEQVVIPAAGALANGVDGGKGTAPGKTWPTSKTKGDAPLQGASAQQTKGPAKGKLEESVQSITEAYVDRKLNQPKLDFKNLKEALSQGMLG